MLTPEDAAAVLRRAAELDTPALEQHDALDETVVRAAAREVGLSDAAVERAVTEWRAGVLAPLPALPEQRRLGLTGQVAVEATLPMSPAVAQDRLEAWLRGQLFERRRTRGPESDWTPRRGVLARARRAADLDHRLRLRPVDRLRLCVAPAATGARVRLVADLDDTRSGLLAGLVAAPALLTALGVATGVGPLPAETLLALPAAVGVGGLGWTAARSVLATRRLDVAEELERVLDDVVHQPVRAPLPQRAASWAAARLARPLR